MVRSKLAETYFDMTYRDVLSGCRESIAKSGICITVNEYQIRSFLLRGSLPFVSRENRSHAHGVIREWGTPGKPGPGPDNGDNLHTPG
jgi:hypothetical protein